jgi:hypothetical protein
MRQSFCTRQSDILCVLVREVSSSQQGIAGKVHTGHNVLSTESDLLDFGKVVDRVSVQGQGTNLLDRDQVLGDKLGGVQ